MVLHAPSLGLSFLFWEMGAIKHHSREVWVLDLVLAYSLSSINAGCGGGKLCLLTRSVELSWVPSEPPGKVLSTGH